MIKYSEPAQTPNPRRRNCTNPIIRYLTEKDDFGDPRWARWFFFFAFLTLFMQGTNIIAPLYWLGIISL